MKLWDRLDNSFEGLGRENNARYEIIVTKEDDMWVFYSNTSPIQLPNSSAVTFTTVEGETLTFFNYPVVVRDRQIKSKS